MIKDKYLFCIKEVVEEDDYFFFNIFNSGKILGTIIAIIMNV